MTNIEKVKRILDAGHWAKVTYQDGYTYTITSYREKTDCYDAYSYIDMKWNMECDDIEFKIEFKNCTIEVIQRIPTPYVAGDKVLVLSNPSPDRSNSEYVDKMVWKVCEVKTTDSFNYKVWDEDKTDYWILPPSCLAPAFDDDKDTDLNLSWKEVTVTIDGKEYTAVIK